MMLRTLSPRERSVSASAQYQYSYNVRLPQPDDSSSPIRGQKRQKNIRLGKLHAHLYSDSEVPIAQQPREPSPTPPAIPISLLHHSPRANSVMYQGRLHVSRSPSPVSIAYNPYVASPRAIAGTSPYHHHHHHDALRVPLQSATPSQPTLSPSLRVAAFASGSSLPLRRDRAAFPSHASHHVQPAASAAAAATGGYDESAPPAAQRALASRRSTAPPVPPHPAAPTPSHPNPHAALAQNSCEDDDTATVVDETSVSAWWLSGTSPRGVVGGSHYATVPTLHTMHAVQRDGSRPYGYDHGRYPSAPSQRTAVGTPTPRSSAPLPRGDFLAAVAAAADGTTSENWGEATLSRDFLPRQAVASGNPLFDTASGESPANPRGTSDALASVPVRTSNATPRVVSVGAARQNRSGADPREIEVATEGRATAAAAAAVYAAPARSQGLGSDGYRGSPYTGSCPQECSGRPTLVVHCVTGCKPCDQARRVLLDGTRLGGDVTAADLAARSTDQRRRQQERGRLQMQADERAAQDAAWEQFSQQRSLPDTVGTPMSPRVTRLRSGYLGGGSSVKASPSKHHGGGVILEDIARRDNDVSSGRQAVKVLEPGVTYVMHTEPPPHYPVHYASRVFMSFDDARSAGVAPPRSRSVSTRPAAPRNEPIPPPSRRQRTASAPAAASRREYREHRSAPVVALRKAPIESTESEALTEELQATGGRTPSDYLQRYSSDQYDRKGSRSKWQAPSTEEDALISPRRAVSPSASGRRRDRDAGGSDPQDIVHHHETERYLVASSASRGKQRGYYHPVSVSEYEENGSSAASSHSIGEESGMGSSVHSSISETPVMLRAPVQRVYETESMPIKSYYSPPRAPVHSAAEHAPVQPSAVELAGAPPVVSRGLLTGPRSAALTAPVSKRSDHSDGSGMSQVEKSHLTTNSATASSKHSDRSNGRPYAEKSPSTRTDARTERSTRALHRSDYPSTREANSPAVTERRGSGSLHIAGSSTRPLVNTQRSIPAPAVEQQTLQTLKDLPYVIVHDSVDDRGGVPRSPVPPSGTALGDTETLQPPATYEVLPKRELEASPVRHGDPPSPLRDDRVDAVLDSTPHRNDSSEADSVGTQLAPSDAFQRADGLVPAPPPPLKPSPSSSTPSAHVPSIPAILAATTPSEHVSGLSSSTHSITSLQGIFESPRDPVRPIERSSPAHLWSERQPRNAISAPHSRPRTSSPRPTWESPRPVASPGQSGQRVDPHLPGAYVDTSISSGGAIAPMSPPVAPIVPQSVTPAAIIGPASPSVPHIVPEVDALMSPQTGAGTPVQTVTSPAMTRIERCNTMEAIRVSSPTPGVPLTAMSIETDRAASRASSTFNATPPPPMPTLLVAGNTPMSQLPSSPKSVPTTNQDSLAQSANAATSPAALYSTRMSMWNSRVPSELNDPRALLVGDDDASEGVPSLDAPIASLVSESRGPGHNSSLDQLETASVRAVGERDGTAIALSHRPVRPHAYALPAQVSIASTVPNDPAWTLERTASPMPVGDAPVATVDAMNR